MDNSIDPLQEVLLVLCALGGLALTTLIVTLAGDAGIGRRLAKLAATIASFGMTDVLSAQVFFGPVVRL